MSIKKEKRIILSETPKIEIWNDDCLTGMPKIPDKSIDMILCDLPYGTTACKWDTIIPFESLWEQYKRIIKDNGAIVLTASQPFTSALVMSNVKMFKYEWVWEKERPTNFISAKKNPLKIHENILIFGGNRYNPIMRELKESSKKRNDRRRDSGFKKKDTTYGDYTHFKMEQTIGRTTGYPLTIIKINRETNNQYKKQVFHPTQKPVALFEYLIKTYTNVGDMVLDNCMGSGTTGVACVNLNRNFIGIEISEKYCQIAEERIMAVLNQKKLF